MPHPRQLYDGSSGYWCKRLTRDPQPEPQVVAGLDLRVPWATLGVKGVETLRDLSRVSEFGVSIPIKAFEVGIEEFDIGFWESRFHFGFAFRSTG